MPGAVLYVMRNKILCIAEQGESTDPWGWCWTVPASLSSAIGSVYNGFPHCILFETQLLVTLFFIWSLLEFNYNNKYPVDLCHFGVLQISTNENKIDHLTLTASLRGAFYKPDVVFVSLLPPPERQQAKFYWLQLIFQSLISLKLRKTRAFMLMLWNALVWDLLLRLSSWICLLPPNLCSTWSTSTGFETP